jgi:ligand-binding sensor domain-containing protein/two-component sensor histidine kinase
MRSVARPLRVAVLVAAVATACFATGQQHAFHQLTPQDGLAQSQVRCMTQDAQGYLWFGTLGGASRYDGHGFENHALQEGLPDAHVSAMVVDARGRLWLGSGSTLVQRDGLRFVREAMPAGTTGARILGLASDGQGRIYVGTDGDGLLVRDEKGMRPLEGYPQDTANSVRSLLALSDGRLLVGLRNGLLLWDKGRCTAVQVGGVEPKAISALAEGRDGSWWVGTFADGLFHIAADGRTTTYDETNGLLLDYVRCLLVDDRDRLWVGTRFGLNVLEKGRMRVFTIHQGMPNDNIWCAYQDREGNLWFGTDGAGALKYAGDRFVTYTVRDGLCSDLVMNITPDAQGDLWLGTYDNGVCRMDGMAMINTLDGLPSNTVWTGLCDRQGVLWFGTNDGLTRLERGVVKPLEGEAALPGKRVLSLHEDAQGGIWAGSREGLTQIDRSGAVVHHTAGSDGPGRSVRAIVGDASGHLWMASEQGVSHFDGKRFRTYTTADGLSDNNILCLVRDRKGRYWAGSTNGLSCSTAEGWRTFRLAPDFGSNYVDLLAEDGSGRIWAGTNNGLFLFHPDSLLVDPAAHEHFTTNEGLRTLEFNQNAVHCDKRGRLFLGSTGGLVFHDTERFKQGRLPDAPVVHITGLRSYLQATDWSDRSDSLSEAGLPIGLALAYRRNYLTFDYTGISLTAPERVLYRYRLLGLDQDWLPPTDARFASYGNLPNGDYTFEVVAAVGDGPWSLPASFSFRIEPPFWLRWWFFALCGTGAAGVLFGIQRYRAVRRARREHTRQLMLRSRMLQLEQQALNANMNRHFVFNALNSIQYHINKQDRTTASRYLSSFAKLIRKNLDASQNDTTTLAEELERLQLYLTLEHMRFKDRFAYAITVAPDVDTAQVRLPAMMLQPYVENSIWHGILPMDRPGRVDITVERKGADRVAVRIEDDGIGLERSMREKQHGEADHISRGIEITKGRADVLRRLDLTDIRISGPEERPPGPQGLVQGTRVVVELPAGTEAKDPGKGLQ